MTAKRPTARRRRKTTRIVGVRDFTAVIERCATTGLFVGSIPGFAGAHSQGATLDELMHNMREVVEMLLEDGDPQLDSEFVGTQNLRVG